MPNQAQNPLKSDEETALALLNLANHLQVPHKNMPPAMESVRIKKTVRFKSPELPTNKYGDIDPGHQNVYDFGMSFFSSLSWVSFFFVIRFPIPLCIWQY
jgi:hypothetical protein